jgi:hypothetical protein
MRTINWHYSKNVRVAERSIKCHAKVRNKPDGVIMKAQSINARMAGGSARCFMVISQMENLTGKRFSAGLARKLPQRSRKVRMRLFGG